MGKYPKHLVVIRDKEYDLGNGFTIEYDLDNLYINCSFNFPYIKSSSDVNGVTTQWDTTDLHKYDAVKIYADIFDNEIDRNNSTSSNMTKIFDGYIDGQPLQLSKDSGWQFQIKCKSRMGLSYERSIAAKFYSGNIQTFFSRALNESGLSTWISNFVISGISPFFQVKLDSTQYFGKVLEQMKDKYAIHVFEDGENSLHVETPYFLSQQGSVEAYEYDIEDNVFDIDFGDKTNRVDTVIVVGSNAIGVAFDPIAYQLKYGTSVNDLQSSISPDPSKLNVRYIYRRDLFSQEDCQEIARNKLVEFAKNNTITFKTIFQPQQKVGEPFIVKNADKIPDTQLWTIKKITVTISNGDISSSIVGYSNSVVEFPEDILLSSTGILDTDILEVTDKVESSLDIRG